MDDFTSIINEQLKQLKEAVQERGRVNLLVQFFSDLGYNSVTFQYTFPQTSGNIIEPPFS